MGLTTNLQHEQSFLSFILGILKKNIDLLELDYKDALEKLYELYAQYSPETPEYYMDMPFAENMVEFFKTELANSRKSLSSPYFGKVIFNQDDEPDTQTLYIGKKGLLNRASEKKEQLIIDWRAPVSEV